jgi:hypothetical protein
VRTASDRVQQRREIVQAADAAIKRMIAVHRLAPDSVNPQKLEQEKIIATTSAEIKRLEAVRDERGAASQAIARIVADANEWLLNAVRSGFTFEVVDVVPELKKGEMLAAALERIQRRGRELAADLHAVRCAPRPSQWAKQAMRQQVAALAERGRPHVGSLCEHGEPVSFSDVPRSAQVRNVASPALAVWIEPDLLGLFAWLHEDKLVEKLDAEIMAEADDAAALSDVERKRRETELAADILANARVEAALCWRMADADAPLALRPDLPVEALLGVAAVPKAQEAEPPSKRQSWRVWPLGTE